MQEEVQYMDEALDTVLQIPPIRWILQGLFRVYVLVFVLPTFKLLYLGAPHIGFEKREAHDICHQLTNYAMSPDFWKQPENTERCNRLIFTKFKSRLSMLNWVILVSVLFVILRWMLQTLREATIQAFTLSYNKIVRNTRDEIHILRREMTPSPKKRREENLTKTPSPIRL
jgi:hypothetical protein